MNKERIKLTDNIMDVVLKMSDSNPGAMNTLMQIIEYGRTESIQGGGLRYILLLDSLGIYGTDMYVLNSDICQGDISKMLAVLDAVQFGLFSGDVLRDASHRQDYSGKYLVPVDELYTKVEEYKSKL